MNPIFKNFKTVFLSLCYFDLFITFFEKKQVISDHRCSDKWETFKIGATFCILGVLVLFPEKYTRHMDCLMSVVQNHSVTIEECYFTQSFSRLHVLLKRDDFKVIFALAPQYYTLECHILNVKFYVN